MSAWTRGGQRCAAVKLATLAMTKKSTSRLEHVGRVAYLTRERMGTKRDLA
jgi:hypothetical protein